MHVFICAFLDGAEARSGSRPPGISRHGTTSAPGRNGRAVDGRSGATAACQTRTASQLERGGGAPTGPLSLRSPRLAIGAVDIIGADDAMNDVDDGDDEDDDEESVCISSETVRKRRMPKWIEG